MKYKRIYTLLFLLSFIVSCFSSSVPIKTEVTKGTLSPRLEALKFEEVELVTAEGERHRGKVVSLEGESIEFRPFPYWNVELIKLNLDDIHSIKLTKKRSGAANGFASGFGWAFIFAGTIGGAGSKYNVDYENALLASAIVGGAGGLIGLAIGAIRDFSIRKKFDFFKMSGEKKEQAIRKIMGLPAR
jgi:hypothetical protein